MDLKQFALPDVGEGLTEADILAWRVAVGDHVEVNQILIEVETAKAAVELPSPWAGVVTALLVAEGETVDVGRPIITIDASSGASSGSSSSASASASGASSGPAGASAAATDLVPSPAAGGGDAVADPASGGAPARQPVLVGYGPAADSTPRRRRRATAEVPSVQPAFDVPRVPPVSAAVPSGSSPASPTAAASAGAAVSGSSSVVEPRGDAHRVLAKPPVRKLAKTLGVDLAAVAPTGPHGTVSRADVEQAARPTPVPESTSGQRETRVPVKGIRRATAAAMVASAFTAPHVTEFVTVDVTATMELRERVAARREFAGVKVSPLLFVARAVIFALARTPELNATWDEAAGEIVLKHYVNLGIAAATDRGLIVPSIPDAQRMGLRDLATAITDLTETARAGRTTPAALTSGTFTITNVGVFGVDTGTPIINPGEAGILAFGAVRRMPWVVGTGPDERIEPRWVTQLAVSFDHRLVDGAQGSQFLSDVANLLNDPGLALLHA